MKGLNKNIGTALIIFFLICLVMFVIIKKQPKKIPTYDITVRVLIDGTGLHNTRILLHDSNNVGGIVRTDRKGICKLVITATPKIYTIKPFFGTHPGERQPYEFDPPFVKEKIDSSREYIFKARRKK